MSTGALEQVSHELLQPQRSVVKGKSWWQYAVAVGCVLAAFGIRYWLTPVLGEEMPFMLFIAAVMAATWCGGTVMGVVALMLGLFLADSFFLKPHGVPSETRSLEALQFLRYLFTASLGIVLIEVQRRGQLRTEAALEELRREIIRRQRSEEELLQAKDQLSRLAEELEGRVVDRTAKLVTTVGYLQGLLYHIGHNLRAPLRAISGYTTFLLEEYGAKLDDTAHSYARHISDSSRRMDALIDDLLDYGRLGHIEIKLSTVSLEQALQHVLYGMAYEIETRKARIEVSGPLPEVLAEPELLEQVLSNLVENAVTFVSPGSTPHVRIHAEARGTAVRLWIQDNGIGIDPRHHKRIFGVFQTLHPVRGPQGDGIGLAIVKQAMERMGGSVGLESQLGSGCRFWVEFAEASNRLS